MLKLIVWVSALLAAHAASGWSQGLDGQRIPTFQLELEGGPVWQSRNRVQIPNDETGTRFSLLDVVGEGAWPAIRLYATWNLDDRHGIRALLAPLSVTESGALEAPVSFAGGDFDEASPVRATYRFNSWRVGYRYRAVRRPDLSFWVGFTAKLRDAEIRLEQGDVVARDTDLGFVPLLHLAADWSVTERTHVLFDFDGLAGGPGRAFDTAVKLGYEVGSRWMISGGYRTLEGGADVDSVYNFAWLHYGALSVTYRP